MPEHNGHRIDIACVVDSNYAPHLAALAKSIERNSCADEIVIHVVHDDLSEPLQDEIASSSVGIRFVWHGVTDHIALSLPPLLQISRATYLRLILDELLDRDLRRVLYIDIDVIVTSSLRPLWETDLGEFACAAVADPGVDSELFAAKQRLARGAGYFNAGVMLLDMVRIREQRILANALTILLEGGRDFEFGDQDALNVALWNNWRGLDATWNFQREFLYDGLRAWRALSDGTDRIPRIVHFTESSKPWNRQEWHPFAWLYWKYLMLTPFYRRVRRREGIRLRDVVKTGMKFRLKRPRLGGS